MTLVFVDTSGIYAFLVRGDDQHLRAREAMSKLRAEFANLLTSSYVLHETATLLQARI